MPKNVEDWGKLIVAKGFKKLPKVHNIAQSGHTATHVPWIEQGVNAVLLVLLILAGSAYTLIMYYTSCYTILCSVLWPGHFRFNGRSEYRSFFGDTNLTSRIAKKYLLVAFYQYIIAR